MTSEAARRALDEGASVEDVFRAEARDRLARARRLLDAGFPRPGTPELSTLHRQAHSLKGTAGSLGHGEIARLARDIIERLAPFERDAPSVPDDAQEAVRRGFERLEAEVRALDAQP